MRAVITGAGGQVGTELVARTPNGIEAFGLTRSQCDISKSSDVIHAVREIKPQIVINAAAYTAVDRAESESEIAFAINSDGARNVARAAYQIGARLVHLSTDYVFDGNRSSPYPPDAHPNPLGVYGASKLAGENEVASCYPRALIVRTGWVYAALGRNFLTTVLRLLGSAGPLRIVSDQIGTPTSATEFADALWACASERSLCGTAHWANAGHATRYDFAEAIRRLALERSVVLNPADVTPITAREYPTAARRPRYSVLECSFLWSKTGIPNDWRVGLQRVFDQIRPDVHAALEN